MENYLTIEKFKKFYNENFEFDNEWIDLQLESGSAYLRSIFKSYGLNLDKELEDEKVELITIQNVLASLVIRKMTSINSPFGGNFSNISQSAGVYSSSLTLPSGSNSNFYLTSSDLKSLNLPSISVSELTIKLNW